MKKPCDVCHKVRTVTRMLDGGLVCDRCQRKGYSDEMPDFSEPETPEPQQVNRHETLVNRLRMPIDPSRAVLHVDNDISNLGLRALADKLDAIGEALAYLIDKKHSKLRRQKLKKKVKVFRKSRKS